MRQSVNPCVCTQWLCPFYQIKMQMKAKNSNATYKPRKNNKAQVLKQNRNEMKKLQNRL